MKHVIFCMLGLLLLTCIARADYMEITSERAVLRADPTSDSERIRGLDKGERLVLRPVVSVGGWHAVRDHNSYRDGWVYRNFARFHEGDIPGVAPAPTPTDITTRANAPGLPHSFYILEEPHYSVGYDPRLKIPAWVQYTLRAEDLDGPGDREGLNFEPRQGVSELFQATNDDYSHSGYAKGHMAAAEDMTRTQTAVEDTFFYTNAAPQIGSAYNGSKWSTLERKTREWTRARGELVVVMGPVFDLAPPDEPEDSPNAAEDGWVKYKTIGDGRVAVAHGFFRVIYDVQTLEAIAFYLPHRDVTGTANAVQNFVTTIDEIEAMAGIDLFPDLPDTFEATLESTRASELWAGIKANGNTVSPIPVPDAD